MTTPTNGKLPGVYKPSAKKREAYGICVYGRSGAGKTRLLGTMPGKGLVIDIPQIEGGTFVLSDVADRIDIVPVAKWEEIQPIFWYLKRETHSYNWVAIDSLSAMTELAKRKSLSERSLEADPHVISKQEWGKVGRLCGELIYQFRTLPIHTIWIAQERKFGTGDDDDSGMTIGPDVSPSSLAALLPSMLLCGRLSVEHTMDGTWERHFRIGPAEGYYTKARTAPGIESPAIVRNPNLGEILTYLLGLSTKRPDEVDESAIILG